MTEGVRLEGYEEYRQKLRGSPRVLNKHLRRGMQQVGVKVQRALERYPSPPSGSRYQRTGELGSRWSFRVLSGMGTVRGLLENPTEHGPWVQSDEVQAKVHRGRWPTAGKVVKRAKVGIDAIFQKELDAAVKEIDR